MTLTQVQSTSSLKAADQDENGEGNDPAGAEATSPSAGKSPSDSPLDSGILLLFCYCYCWAVCDFPLSSRAPITKTKKSFVSPPNPTRQVFGGSESRGEETEGGRY